MSTETSSSRNSFFAGNNIVFSLMMIAVISMVVAIGAIGVVSVAKSDGSGGAGSSGTTTVNVSLTEFKITLDPAVVPPGKVVLNITNGGTTAHNVAALTLGKRSNNLNAGETTTLDLGAVSGDVELICEVSGHKDSGMVATLKTGTDAASSGSGGGDSGMGDMSGHTMSNEEMDAQMLAVANRFLDQLKGPITKGQGNQELKPTVGADGTKVFNLTAKIVDWEIEPGKTVKAWTYNGMVPGPILRANLGDKVRIVLKNDLPESTSLHLHGVRVPNAVDGVDPYTQNPVKPGETFTYEFTAIETAVGMYHSHHNAQVQIPNGMAGALLIGDWKSMAMKTALAFDRARVGDADGKAEREVVMVLNDAGTIGLSLNGKSFPATEAYVMNQGETMVVHYYNEGLMAHPMHMHQPHGLVVAKDGVMLASPYWTDTINVAPGERYTVVYNMKDKGAWAWHCHILNHAETPQGMKYMVTAVIVK